MPCHATASSMPGPCMPGDCMPCHEHVQAEPHVQSSTTTMPTAQQLRQPAAMTAQQHSTHPHEGEGVCLQAGQLPLPLRLGAAAGLAHGRGAAPLAQPPRARRRPQAGPREPRAAAAGAGRGARSRAPAANGLRLGRKDGCGGGHHGTRAAAAAAGRCGACRCSARRCACCCATRGACRAGGALGLDALLPRLGRRCTPLLSFLARLAC